MIIMNHVAAAAAAAAATATHWHAQRLVMHKLSCLLAACIAATQTRDTHACTLVLRSWHNLHTFVSVLCFFSSVCCCCCCARVKIRCYCARTALACVQNSDWFEKSDKHVDSNAASKLHSTNTPLSKMLAKHLSCCYVTLNYSVMRTCRLHAACYHHRCSSELT
jgi:hypothetical protein